MLPSIMNSFRLLVNNTGQRLNTFVIGAYLVVQMLKVNIPCMSTHSVNQHGLLPSPISTTLQVQWLIPVAVRNLWSESVGEGFFREWVVNV